MKRRNPKDTMIPQHPLMIAQIQGIPKAKDRALAAFLYLTAARVSEIVGKGIRIELSPAINQIAAITEKGRVNAIRKQDIEFLEQDGSKFALIHNVMILKRRKIALRRTIPINLTKEAELWGIVQQHLDSISLPSQPLFNMDRTTAYRHIYRSLGYWPHFLRHCRITHLVTDYGFDAMGLVQFIGWAKTDMALEYAHLRPVDLMRRMLQ